ncbi:MAG: hypothetical protein JWQ48_393 [Conexibacter sp.]|nr:hypothetical protein [Conexibacter sp.]
MATRELDPAAGLSASPVRDGPVPAARGDRPRRVDARTALWAIPPTSAVVGGLSLAHADPARIGDLGLISAIPVGVFASLALLTLGFAVALRESRLRPALLAAHILVLLLLLPGAPALLEHEPRFATAWLHAGFVDYIANTGSTLPNLDARFSWPGFFAAAAVLTRGLGLRDPAPVLTWAPLAFDLLALVPVYAIAAMTTKDARVPWLATWLFIPANWVGQDYFSPQAFAFVLFLGFVVVLLRYFSVGTELRRPPRALDRGGLFVILLLIYCAIVWSHQLTPYFAVAATAGLVLVGACRLRTLPLLLAVIVVAFVSYLAVSYWAGHLADVLGGIGKLGSTFSSNVGNRVSGSPAHEWVSRLRIVMTAAVSALALIGVARRWRRRSSSIPLVVLLVAPYPVLALQAYGGEVLLRTYLFALPFAAALMAAGLVPSARRRGSAASAVVVPLVTAALVAGFFVARFGNEAFEMVRPGEVAAIHRLYRVAAPASTLASIDENVAWRSTGIASFTYVTLPIERASPRRYLQFVSDEIARNPNGGYLLVTASQIQAARLVGGVSRGWLAGFRRALAVSPRFRLVYSNRDARLYRFRPPAKVFHGP